VNTPKQSSGFVRTALWFTIPSLLLVLSVWWSTSASVESGVVRFVNAMLTSFTLVSFMLLVTLFAYGDARRRPIAPLAGMIFLVLAGVALTMFFLSQGDLLMEENASVRAQFLSNIVRFATTSAALVVATVVVGGTLLASLLNTPPRAIVFEEE
jgi:hypothetical protein